MKLSEILGNLGIDPKGSVVYFHIASDKLKPIFNIKHIFETLDTFFDDSSTICMPSFPFTGSGYFDYLKKNPVFDVRTTPSRVNLITEIFRRRDRVIRSLHPWCSVACKGYLAKELISEHHLNSKVFGEKSPFSKIMHSNGYVVGLGVDCNTNSFAHMPDDRMLQYYKFKVYEAYNIILPCIDYQGREIKVETNVVEKRISKLIKPLRMKELFNKEDFYKEISINDINFYSMQVSKFIDFTYETNIEIVKQRGYPLYYDFNRAIEVKE